MARVSGIDLPKHKRVDVALRYLFGIGPARSVQILEVTGVQPATRVKDLTEAEVSKINTEIAKNFKVEGDLRREISANVRRLIEIGAYRGSRHRRNLPARGQRTKSNARTRRGRRRTVGSAKPGTVGAPAAAPGKA
ncbi:MAG: 30S ribosomal protein S13 [Elusimicrobia bacterium]|nr:30S ribosomal protein S13 [Elusimicrobiota bacterium]